MVSWRGKTLTWRKRREIGHTRFWVEDDPHLNLYVLALATQEQGEVRCRRRKG